jgi:hypothetical protein
MPDYRISIVVGNITGEQVGAWAANKCSGQTQGAIYRLRIEKAEPAFHWSESQGSPLRSRMIRPAVISAEFPKL